MPEPQSVSRYPPTLVRFFRLEGFCQSGCNAFCTCEQSSKQWLRMPFSAIAVLLILAALSTF